LCFVDNIFFCMVLFDKLRDFPEANTIIRLNPTIVKSFFVFFYTAL